MHICAAEEKRMLVNTVKNEAIDKRKTNRKLSTPAIWRQPTNEEQNKSEHLKLLFIQITDME